MGNGSISHNWFDFTAFFLILQILSMQGVLTGAKKVKLSELLGKVEEEEPEGEALSEGSSGSIAS